MRLALLAILLLPTHIPKPTLVRREGSVIPHIDKDTLSTILIRFILDLLHLHLHAVLAENHILLLHLLARVLADVLHNGVSHVPDAGEDRDEDEKKDEGEDVVLGLCHCKTKRGSEGVVARGRKVKGGEPF